MSKFALLFSGQGAQKVGMGTDLAEASPAPQKILQMYPDILHAGFSAVLKSETEGTLTGKASPQHIHMVGPCPK